MVIGEPVDEMGPIGSKKFAPIHRAPPTFEEQSTEVQMLMTGIKVVDLLAPYAKGGKIGLFGGAGVGKNSSYSRNSFEILPLSTEGFSICGCWRKDSGR